jgi:ribosomal protein S18 acetylase RimI-like enzyme
VTDLADLALATDAANFQLGNEAFSLANATFVRSRETPDIYDSNHVAGISARTPREIEELLAAADREYQHAGHRRFDVDYRTPPEFVARLLLDGGYERQDSLIFVLEGELRGADPACEIRPMTSDADWEAFWELMFMDWVDHHERIKRPVKEEVARRMWQAKRLKTPPVRYWLAYDGKRAVAYLNSWEGVGGVGQVEDLFTHPDYRHRGIATALIHHGVADCRAKGAGPVVIVADPTDTPKNIYARMGFRPVAWLSKYLKRLEAD